MSKVAKRNRMVKIFCVILMVCMFLSVANVAFGETTINSITGEGANLGEQGNELVKTIVSWLTGIGMAVSVIVLLILGIKYMIGSAEEKAEYKKTMIPYLIGAALVFGASFIANVVYNLFKGFGQNSK